MFLNLGDLSIQTFFSQLRISPPSLPPLLLELNLGQQRVTWFTYYHMIGKSALVLGSHSHPLFLFLLVSGHQSMQVTLSPLGPICKAPAIHQPSHSSPRPFLVVSGATLSSQSEFGRADINGSARAHIYSFKNVE